MQQRRQQRRLQQRRLQQRSAAPEALLPLQFRRRPLLEALAPTLALSPPPCCWLLLLQAEVQLEKAQLQEGLRRWRSCCH